ncbi:hypothetical protein NP233_g8220 [Leucocoprinus birnbaumii]|uniref:Uncharacterized protein n=1 Tax=Leucocoprinus birnbaumii TaxID=56174 RepID=A0AAD5VNI1_9AGAR|nr:hypothetical protein NP233_g8220 [Leucocoprinus birnbaumii]
MSTAPSPPPDERERQRIHPPPKPEDSAISAIKLNSSKQKNISQDSVILEKLFDIIRWYNTHSKDAFGFYPSVMIVGLRDYYKDRDNLSDYVDDDEPMMKPERKARLIACFAALERCSNRFERFVVALISQPPEDNVIRSLGTQMEAVRSSACSNDWQTAIKQRLHEIVQSVVSGNKLEPRQSFVEQFELDYEGSVAKVHSSEISIADDALPGHLYPPGTKYNPKNIRKGAFRGRAWILAYKILFTAPTFAKTVEYKEIASKSKARTNNLYTVTPETIAYACYLRHVSNVDLEKRHEAIYEGEFLTPDTKWWQQLFKWANNLIFDSPGGSQAAPELTTTGLSDIQLMNEQNEADDDCTDDEDEEPQRQLLRPNSNHRTSGIPRRLSERDDEESNLQQISGGAGSQGKAAYPGHFSEPATKSTSESTSSSAGHRRRELKIKSSGCLIKLGTLNTLTLGILHRDIVLAYIPSRTQLVTQEWEISDSRCPVWLPWASQRPPPLDGWESPGLFPGIYIEPSFPRSSVIQMHVEFRIVNAHWPSRGLVTEYDRLYCHSSRTYLRNPGSGEDIVILCYGMKHMAMVPLDLQGPDSL